MARHFVSASLCIGKNQPMKSISYGLPRVRAAMHADHERRWRLAPTRGRDVITNTSGRPPKVGA